LSLQRPAKLTPRRNPLTSRAAIAAVLMLAGCAATPSSTPRPTTTPPPATPLPIIGATCGPNANDACLGPLAAGTQTSVLFAPRITFDIPAGWYNHEDSLGAYVLYPPGSKTPASEGGTRDWIAFLGDVMMPDVGCPPGDPVDLGDSAADIAARMAGRINLTTTSPQPATVGGLTGTVLDVRLAANATVECFNEPAVNLLHGLGRSYGYDQGIGAGSAYRIYLFDRGTEVLAIEIDDVSGGTRLDEFAAVLDTLQFAP
jgi:hypothetical protein